MYGNVKFQFTHSGHLRGGKLTFTDYFTNLKYLPNQTSSGQQMQDLLQREEFTTKQINIVLFRENTSQNALGVPSWLQNQ